MRIVIIYGFSRTKNHYYFVALTLLTDFNMLELPYGKMYRNDVSKEKKTRIGLMVFCWYQTRDILLLCPQAGWHMLGMRFTTIKHIKNRFNLRAVCLVYGQCYRCLLSQWIMICQCVVDSGCLQWYIWSRSAFRNNGTICECRSN